MLMRLHHVLCERMGKAVRLAEGAKALKAQQVKILYLSGVVSHILGYSLEMDPPAVACSWGKLSSTLAS